MKPLVEIRVFFDRMGLILAAIPHLWVHYADWDSEACIETLLWRLRRLERVMTHDPYTDQTRTEDLRRFLALIAERGQGTERVGRCISVERHIEQPFGRKDYDDKEEAEIQDWANAVHEYDEKAWKDAWDWFRQKAREWWT